MTLGVIFVIALVLSNLIAGKMTAVGGLALTAADFLFPLTYVLGDVFTEVYGFKNSRHIIWLGFGCNLFAVAGFQATVWLPAPEFWHDQTAYATVFSTAPRILFASLAGYLVGEFSNAAVLSRMKVMTRGRHLWARTIGSSVIGEALDTGIFATLAYFGTIPGKELIALMLTQYIWKLLYETALTPVTYITVRRLKTVEGIDIYDRPLSPG